MTYSAACDLVVRLRARVGFDFDPHWLRHCMATRALRDGVPLEVVSKLLGHSSTTVTEQVYGHLTVEDARQALEAVGSLWLESDGVDPETNRLSRPRTAQGCQGPLAPRGPGR